MDALERDASEVLSLVRSAKNSFAPISRIPPEILSLIPDYHDGGDEDDGYIEEARDEDLITLTHVCCGWRDTFTSRSSLWTRLDFKNVDKTHTYIQRSRSSPLELYLVNDDSEVLDVAFPLVIPHIHRLKSLIIDTSSLPTVLRHFCCRTPLLEKLDIKISAGMEPLLDDALFGGDQFSLRNLRLEGVTTHLPWKNLANLRVLNLDSFGPHGTTQMLDFLESAPLLHTIFLLYPTSHPSDAPPERMVTLNHLRHLNVFTLDRDYQHPALLRHLHFPTGASVISEFNFNGSGSPLLDYLPERSSDPSNLSHVTTINLLLDSTQKFAQLGGPSGSLRVLAEWQDLWNTTSYTLDRKILHSLGPPILSTTQRLTISRYGYPRPDQVEECPVFHTLSLANDLRILTLIDCDNLPFILALDPEQSPSDRVLCANMEELVVYDYTLEQFHVDHLISMTKNRASRGARLSSITIFDLNGCMLGKEVLKLREHVTHVEYEIDDEPPWDDVPGESK